MFFARSLLSFIMALELTATIITCLVDDQIVFLKDYIF